ncbi:hypothetical protein pipiens_017129 [Culex pipiens pipiens]|uniref:Uncharacterized protein n=1 Tax=Culex pipiens pipiens TaxID=38569 RepID=A0ABD1CHZ9_CULPP
MTTSRMGGGGRESAPASHNRVRQQQAALVANKHGIRSEESQVQAEANSIIPQTRWHKGMDRLREEKAKLNHRILYKESSLSVQFGDTDGIGSVLSRSFGVTILSDGTENRHGPVRDNVKTIGLSSEGGQQNFQKYYLKTMTIRSDPRP